jgi:hypothetical protein
MNDASATSHALQNLAASQARLLYVHFVPRSRWKATGRQDFKPRSLQNPKCRTSVVRGVPHADIICFEKSATRNTSAAMTIS